MATNYIKLASWSQNPSGRNNVRTQRLIFFDDAIPESVDDALRLVYRAGEWERPSVFRSVKGLAHLPVIGEFPADRVMS